MINGQFLMTDFSSAKQMGQAVIQRVLVAGKMWV